jgi:hypothetical protein
VLLSKGIYTCQEIVDQKDSIQQQYAIDRESRASEKRCEKGLVENNEQVGRKNRLNLLFQKGAIVESRACHFNSLKVMPDVKDVFVPC